jgi:lauroyl/myristoyl acyltransferase
MLARVARRVDPRHTKAAREFVDQALPSLPTGEREALVLQSWRYFLMLLLRNVAFDRHVPLASRVSHYEQEFSPAAREIFDRRTPCIVITAHVGDFEAGAALFPAMGFRHAYAVVAAAEEPAAVAVHAAHARGARVPRHPPPRRVERHREDRRRGAR